MKLASFDDAGTARAGLVRGDEIFAASALVAGAPDSAQDLIAAWDRWRGPLEAALKAAKGGKALGAVHLLAPVPRPGKILAIGLNYADHIAESGQKTPEHQVWFCKQPTSANGPFDPIDLPKASTMLDYEAEMVAVIGKECRHVRAADAKNVIFGYACGNDVTARDWQFKTPQWMLGKSFDTHAPFGPWITTADEIADPHALGIRGLVNGETRQASNTRHLVFDVFAQIEEVSKVMTLEPGDLIFTGTPGGVGIAMKPPAMLKAGDLVRIEIEGLGAIENKVRPEAA
ncbi:MAG: 5-carboxymethyl-2-hydroxymuconate isomerase [Alphaproteobacteria bacterium]|nr:5-carboxymethyl-2-hydroxymuconate isomerase [Alphaproteobacteria bacterium]